MIKKYFIPNAENQYKPHIFRETAVIALFVFTLAIFILCSFFLPQLERSTETAEIYSSVVTSSTNFDRNQYNLLTLSVNPLLEEAAKEKAADMAAKGYFAHNSPEGLTPWYWISKAGYNYVYAGENLAVDFTDSNDVVQAWMNSPGHRANILNDHYTEIGVATAQGEYQGRPTIFVVEMFGSPKIALAATTPLATNSSTSTLATTQPTPTPKPAPKVLSAESKPHTKTIAPVEGMATSVSTTAPVLTTIVPAETSQTEPTAFQKILVNPSKTLRLIYLLLALFIIISLALFIFIEWRVQHPKNIAYACLLLIILGSFFYINWILFVVPAAIV
jgi:hypothetical protein